MPDARPVSARAAAHSVRAFVAVARDPVWAESARQLVEALRPVSPAAAWTRPMAWHLTIKFLGESPLDALEDFSRAVAPAASALAPGALRTEGAAVFPSRGPARVLALGFARTRALEDLEGLASAAEKEARRLGLDREDRAFHPHVTLARVRFPWPREAVECFRRAAAQWKFPEFQARACVLYGSRLAPGGVVHTPIAEWPFGASEAGATA